MCASDENHPAADKRDVTVVLDRVAAGDPRAAEELLPLVYDRLRALGEAYLKNRPPDQTLQATALVHEAYLKMIHPATGKTGASGDATWKDRAHFFAVAARAMRQFLADSARRRLAQKRGGQGRQVALTGLATPGSNAVVDVVALDDVLRRLATLDERQAKIVEMRFFGGLTNEEVSHVLGVSTRTVEKEWRKARAWLSMQLSTESES